MEGDFAEEFAVVWQQSIRQDAKTTWGDSRETAEFGATALALLLILAMTDYHEFERKEQGGGFDFAIWKPAQPTGKVNVERKSGRVEVSGILKETPGNTINMRVAIKKRQAAKSTELNLQIFIVIVEFGMPKAKIVQS